MQKSECRVVVPGGGWDCSRARAAAGRPGERVSSLPGTEEKLLRAVSGCSVCVAPETVANENVVD